MKRSWIVNFSIKFCALCLSKNPYWFSGSHEKWIHFRAIFLFSYRNDNEKLRENQTSTNNVIRRIYTIHIYIFIIDPDCYRLINTIVWLFLPVDVDGILSANPIYITSLRATLFTQFNMIYHRCSSYQMIVTWVYFVIGPTSIVQLMSNKFIYTTLIKHVYRMNQLVAIIMLPTKKYVKDVNVFVCV